MVRVGVGVGHHECGRRRRRRCPRPGDDRALALFALAQHALPHLGIGGESVLDLVDLGNLYVNSDPGRLRQILTNLVGNAIKFTEQGYVKVGVVIEPNAGEGSEVNLSLFVEDSGIGIPAEEQSRIFSTFEQLSGSDENRYRGAGLGLAISQRLTEAMNGTLTLKSQVGEGSVFTINLPGVIIPAAEALASINEPDSTIRPKFRPANLLVVDDVQSNRNLISEHFRDSLVEVRSAQNGQEAIAMAKVSPPDLILMDVVMPGLNGFQATRHITKTEGTQHIPVVMLSSKDQDTDKVWAERQGASGYIIKPATEDDLIATINKFLS